MRTADSEDLSDKNEGEQRGLLRKMLLKARIYSCTAPFFRTLKDTLF